MRASTDYVIGDRIHCLRALIIKGRPEYPGCLEDWTRALSPGRLEEWTRVLRDGREAISTWSFRDRPSWVVRARLGAVPCQCGGAEGGCEWSGPAAETTLVLVLPAEHHGSYLAAGRPASWWDGPPVQRLRVERSCAERLLADGPDCFRLAE